MKVIFLDFDGVLNSTQSVIYHLRRNTQYDTIFFGDWCPIAFSNLVRILDKLPEAKIVISSSWRCGRTLDELRDILKEHGVVPDKVIDKTPHHSERGSERGWEIQDWLDAHPEVTHYVILDDDADMLEHQKPNFVNTDAHVGLTIHDACHAYGILGEAASLLRVGFYQDYSDGKW